MAGWQEHRGRAVVLAAENVDTDQLIPARFMSVPRSAGYGDYLLHDLRRDDEGALLPDFPLNTPEGASVLIAGRNFGTGSSREAAVYALIDAGFRVVIAPSFGDIFAGNAVNNGLLPLVLPQDALALLQGGLPEEVVVSLPDGVVRCGGAKAAFDLPDSWREKLTKGWDDIDLTLQNRGEIAEFRERRREAVPWVFGV